MADYQDYFDQGDREERHVDTRQLNFEGSDPDPHLEYDMGIDVQG